VRVAEKKKTCAAERPSPPCAMRKPNFLLGFLKGVSWALPLLAAGYLAERRVEEKRRLAYVQGYSEGQEEATISVKISHRPEINRICAICLAFCSVDDGVKCASDQPDESEHFMCSGCLDSYLKIKLEQTGRNALVAGKGKVCCPMCSAQIVGFAKHLSDELLAQYLDAFTQGMSEELEQQFDIRVQQRVDALRNELENRYLAPNCIIDERVRRAEIHVIEEILTVKCPRCSQAFVDFDGCFALQCSRCAAGICGWCMADCGADSHTHVMAGCPANRYQLQSILNPFFDNFKHFEQARMQDRIMRLNEFLSQNLQPELWIPLHKRLVPHLKKLGIELDLEVSPEWRLSPLRSEPKARCMVQ
jgi:hypothetical protein